MYHSISKTQNDSVHPYYQTNTLPNVFESHIKFLWANDYKVVDLHHIRQFQNGQEISAGKYVVITFDDAYKDVYQQAFPILKRYGYTATIYMPTDFINNERRYFQNKACMNWDEAEKLRSAGFSFGSHSVSHRRLMDLEWEEIEYELKHSKEQIERRLGVEVASFSYPFSFPDASKGFVKRFLHMTKEIGYENVVTTNIGTMSLNEDDYLLKRIPVNSWDDPGLFHAKLTCGYDWMRIPQFLFKACIKRDR